MSLDFHKPLTAKKMKKRKELDAFVSSEKLSSKFGSTAANGGVATGVNHRNNSAGNGVSGGGGGGEGRKSSRQSHQLLEESASNSENEIPQGDISGDGELYAQVNRRKKHAIQAKHERIWSERPLDCCCSSVIICVRV